MPEPTTVELSTIITAIADTVKAHSSIPVQSDVQDYDELKEAPGSAYDMPAIQIYPERNEGTDPDVPADRRGFAGMGGTRPIRATRYTITLDLYASHRGGFLGEEMAKLVGNISDLEQVFEDENVAPYFGIAAIKAFTWSWERVTFAVTDQQFVGARFALVVTIF